MAVTVHNCDPDLDVECDSCGKHISEQSIYCSECARRPVEQQEQCATCKAWFARFEMFSKVEGLMCHGCAFKYEMDKFQAVKTA